MIPAEFKTHPYLNLATFRKNGQPVNTPVWFASDGEYLYVLSAGNAGKIKRLNNSPRARVATCTYNGTLVGEWHDAEATVFRDPQQVRHAHRFFREKYGFQMRAFDFFSTLGGKINKRAYIRITLKQSALK